MPKKTFRFYKKRGINTKLIVECSNSFDKLSKSKGLEEENRLNDCSFESEKNIENKVIYNNIELEKKGELYKIKVIITQALETMLKKLVLDQVKE